MTKANMTAAKLTMFSRKQPMRGMNLNRLIIGEKSKKTPQQNKIQAPKRASLEIVAFCCLSWLITSSLKTIPGFITLMTSWKEYLNSFSMHVEIYKQKQRATPSSFLNSSSGQLLLSSPHGTSSLSGFHCLKEVSPLSVFIY